MPVSMTLDAGDPGVLELFAEPRTLRTWEFIRISKAATTISDLVTATGTERTEVHRQVDSLVAQGLLRVLRARKPRREFGYRATCAQIIVSFDDRRP